MYYNPFVESNVTPTLGQLVQKGYPVFNDWWKTFVPEHREELERKIIHAYFFEQIGQETPEKFVYMLNAHLEQIMPYYNKLYESELIKFNPLLNHAVKANGRSIENLVSKANTSDDRFAKTIRDFVGATDRTSLQNSSENGAVKGVKEESGSDQYSKEGTEEIKDHTVTTGTDTDTLKETKTTDGTVKKGGTEADNGTVTTQTDGTTTEKPGEVSTKKTDWGGTEKSEDSRTSKDVTEATGTKKWTETLDDDSTTDTTTKLVENTKDSTQTLFSDTPQKRLDTTVDDTSRLRKDYLTTAQWVDGSSDHTADTTQGVVYKDDQTKEHDETTGDNSTTDSTASGTVTKTRGGVDTETTTKSGQNETTVDKTETATTDMTKTYDVTTKDDTVVTTEGTDTLEKEENVEGTRDKQWTEKGSSSNALKGTNTTTSETSGKVNTTGSDNTREVSNVNQSSVNMTEKKEVETTDKGTTDITEGYMNISASQLLQAFRETFINIDKMIIDELREDFMLVY